MNRPTPASLARLFGESDAPARRPLSFAALDFEIADPDKASVCAIGLCVVRAGRLEPTRAWLVRPPRAAFSLQHIHGIGAADVEAAPSFVELWPRVEALVEDIPFFVAHHAPFERAVLQRCAAVFGVAIAPRPLFCTVQISRAAWRLPRARLPDVCAHLGIPLRHHDAGSDAEACAKIALAAAKAGYPLGTRGPRRARSG